MAFLHTYQHCRQYQLYPQFEVNGKLKKVKLHRSGRPDLIPSSLIREFSYELCFPLSDIFNCSLKEGTVPDIWKSVYVVPVSKCQPHTISKLKPISPTYVFAKVLEDFVTRWIKSDIINVLDKQQCGSLKDCSAAHYLVTSLDKIYRDIVIRPKTLLLVLRHFPRHLIVWITISLFLNLLIQEFVDP